MAVIQSNNNILRVGNGGSQYFAGDYIDIDGNNTISVDYDLSGLSGKVDDNYAELQNVSAGLSGAVDYVSARSDLYSGHIDYVSAHVSALEDCCTSVNTAISELSGSVSTNATNIGVNTTAIYNLQTATASLDAGKLDKTAYQAGGIEYNGVYPIDVNNNDHLISAKTAAFGVQEPLYFVQDDPTALVIGCSATGGGGVEFVRNVEQVTISAGQYTATETINLNASVPSGKIMTGMMTIDYIARSESVINVCDFVVPGNEAKINFNCNYMSPVIPFYLDNTTGTAAANLWFGIRGSFAGTSPFVRIIGSMM